MSNTEDEEMEIKSYVDEDLKKFFKEVIERNKDASTYVLPAELACEMLTKEKMEIIHKIRKEDEIESKRDLARKLDRDISVVSKELDTLWKHGIIEYQEESNNRKIPELTADKIIIEPL